jgi:hypothetical protein
MKIFQYNECNFLHSLEKILNENKINFIFCNKKKIYFVFFLSEFYHLDFEIDSQEIIQIFEKINYPNLLKQIIIFFENNFSLKYFLEIINFFENKFANVFYNFLQKNYFNYENNLKQILEIKGISNELKNTLEKILENFEKFFLFLNENNFFLENKKKKNFPKENFENFILNCFSFVNEFLFLIEEKKCNFEIKEKYKNFFTNDFRNLILENFYLSQGVRKNNREKITIFLIEEKGSDCSFLFEKKNISIINDENDLKNFKKILEKKISSVGEIKRFLIEDLYILVNQNLVDDSDYAIFDYIQDQSSNHDNFLDPCEKKINFNNVNIEKNGLKNFNDENFLLKIYKKIIQENLLKIKKISIYGLKKFFKNEEKFLKEEVLNLKTVKFFDDKFLISNNFDFLIDEIIQDFLLEKKENQTNIILYKMAEKIILEKYLKSYFDFILKKISLFLENFFNFHFQILQQFPEMIFCKCVEIEIQNIKIDGFCFYTIFEKNKIILIDIFYKNILKKDFENFLNPRIFPVALYFRKKYPNYEIEIQYFSSEKIFKIDEKILCEFEENFSEKIENLYK